MANEDVTVLEVSTGQSYQNIHDLQQAIKQLKEDLKDENATAQQNAKTAADLRQAQSLLKDAMYATDKSIDEQIKDSKLLLASNNQLMGSYNDLVRDLAELKSQWRSATDEAERAQLAEEIKRVNDALKDMDEQTGSFKRNVGNYTDSMKKALKDIPSFAQPVKKAMDDVNKTMGLMSKQPILAAITLIAPVIMKITSELKKNETAQLSIQKVLKAFEPVLEAGRAIIEKIAGWISVATDRIVEFSGQHADAFKRFVAGATGVGNAILQFILTPIRQAIDAVKGLGTVISDVFTGQWGKIKEDARNTITGISDAFKRGFDFKGNFAAGKEAGEAFIAGLGASKQRAKETGVGIGTAVAEGVEEGIEQTLRLYTWEELERMREEYQQKEAKRWAFFNELQQQNAQDLAAIDKELAAQEQELIDEISAMWDEYEADQRARVETERQIAEARRQVIEAYVYGTVSLLESLADTMEAESDGSEKVANQVKNIRIAAATIDTIAGAVKGYMAGIATIPVPSWAGIALGVINAATITAAGAAQIAKIKSTNVSKNGSSSSVTPSTMSAATPTIPTSTQQSSLVAAAYNTEQLNERTKDQRVYILQSDLEASGRQVAVRENETTF